MVKIAKYLITVNREIFQAQHIWNFWNKNINIAKDGVYFVVLYIYNSIRS